MSENSLQFLVEELVDNRMKERQSAGLSPTTMAAIHDILVELQGVAKVHGLDWAGIVEVAEVTFAPMGE